MISRSVPARMTTTLSSTVRTGAIIVPCPRAGRSWTTISVSALAGKIFMFYSNNANRSRENARFKLCQYSTHKEVVTSHPHSMARAKRQVVRPENHIEAVFYLAEHSFEVN